ncbi:MAG: hypothetical protein ACK4NR_01570 [Micavibrio sp.]
MVKKIEPSIITQAQTKFFFDGIASDRPELTGELKKLEGTLKSLPLELNNKVVPMLQADTSGTLDKVKQAIDKDPSIIAKVNRDPSLIAGVLGIKLDTPVAQQTQEAGKPSAPASQTPVAAATPATTPVSAPQSAAPVNPMQAKLEAKFEEIQKMDGYKEVMARLNDPQHGQSLKRAMDSILQAGQGSPEDSMKALEEIQKDPQFFVKMNKNIDEIPPQMRENVFSSIAENPALGRAAITGDQNAKMQLMMGGMFGGGAGGGLSNLFGPNSPLQGITQMLGNLLPKLMQGLMETFKPMIDGLKKFAGANGLMGGMGNGGGELLKQYSRTVDNALGTTSGQTPVVDARDPQGSPARPVAEYNGPYEPTGKLTVIPKPEQDPKLAQTGQQPALSTS